MKEQPGAIIVYWLVPAEPARTFFTSMIKRLAAQYDAPDFEPHLTIFGGERGAIDPVELLKMATANLRPIQLAVRGVKFSDKYTKTLFVEFALNEALQTLADFFRRAMPATGGSELEPHLSLIYKTMPRVVQKELAVFVEVPFSEVVFDSAKAILCPIPIATRADVETWQTLGSVSLDAR